MNDSAVSGTKQKPILINDEGSDGADEDDGDDSDDDSFSDFIDDGLESKGIPQHAARSRRILDDDEDDPGDLSNSQAPVLSSPLRLLPDLSGVDEADGSNHVKSEDRDSDSSTHSGIHVQPNTRSESGWRLVLSTSSSNNSTPRKNMPSDSLLPSVQNPFALCSSSTRPTLSPVSGSLFACSPATTSSLLCNGDDINNDNTSEAAAIDPFLSLFETGQGSSVVQHTRQKCGWAGPTQNGRGVAQPGQVAGNSLATHVFDDPLTSIRARVRKPASSCGSAKEQLHGGPSRKPAKKRRKVRRAGTRRKKGGMRLKKKRRQPLQFVSHRSVCDTDDDDPNYVPDPKRDRSLLTPQGKLRTRARTAATHSPCGRNPAFTAAVLEAQSCPDSSDGLIKARAVLNRERVGGGVGRPTQRTSRRGCRNSSPSRGVVGTSNSDPTYGVQGEIARRTVPKRRLIQIAGSVTSPLSPISPPATR